MIIFPSLKRSTIKIMLFMLFMFGFFGLKIFQINGLHYLVSLTFLYVAFRYKNVIFPYKIYIYLFVLGFVGSCVYSNFMNGQPFWVTMSYCNMYIGLVFALFLIHRNISALDLEKMFVFISILYCLLYIVQWIVFPFTLVSTAELLDTDTEIYRLRIPGSICAFGLYFYGINQFLLKKKSQGVLYAALGGLPIIIMGFRTLTILTVICSFLMVAFVTQKVKKTLGYFLLFSILSVGIINIPIVSEKIEEMASRQENEEEAGAENNIRIIGFDYLTNVQFTKPCEKLFGGGIPVTNSKYAKELDSLATDNHIYWVDIGLVGLSYVIGIPTVLILCFIYILCMWRCKLPNLQYIRFTAMVLVLGSAFTTIELYRTGNILLFSILLCIEYQRNRKISEKGL